MILLDINTQIMDGFDACLHIQTYLKSEADSLVSIPYENESPDTNDNDEYSKATFIYALTTAQSPDMIRKIKEFPFNG